MKQIVEIGLLAALAATSIAGSALAGDKWGAFAVDTADKTKAPYYGVGGGDTEKEASEYAMKFCKEAGGKECTLAVTYEQCGALSSNGKSLWWGKAPSQKEAEAQALQGCNGSDCKIVSSDCN
ncbi:DUF4189 domain-containing protein [Rhizobium sp. C1]|uniref:DUF4189 domain-containing protein n=1 Tax=Rhizobium sp. C1 TaxID=1349799 RepID=UPI001E2B5F37|nr:DUF4189 domain-containing protein [Rhizobium sp. C1]MCD2179889.1 DUF4189 domain-containing protein [Rhizobium sp. C1]